MEKPLSEFKSGEKAIVKRFVSKDPSFIRKMIALDIEIEEELHVVSHWPGFIIRNSFLELVIDKEIANQIIVLKS